MALTDLTNTTWVLNSSLSSYPGGTYNKKTYNINITTEQPVGNKWNTKTNDTFVACEIGYNSGSEYNEFVVWETSSPSSSEEEYQLATGHDTKSLPDTWNTYYDGSFTITGGTDATNSTLIAWFEENATAPPVPDVVVTYNDNDIVTMTDSSVKTLATSGTYCTDDIKITFTKQSGGGSTGYTYIAEDVNYGSVKLGNVSALIASGTNSVAQGSSSTAQGNYSHAEGSESRAGGSYSHAEGSGNFASGDASHAEGNNSVTRGYAAHAEGNKSWASSYAAHAEGNQSRANGNYSHAEGYATTAAGAQSHAEGYYSLASTATAHAEGDHTTASGYASHAQGNLNLASGDQAFVSGYQSTASHRNSIAVGQNVKTSHNEQAVFGAFNADDSTALLLVGNGTSTASADRSNALAVHTDGRVSAGAGAQNNEDLLRKDDIVYGSLAPSAITVANNTYTTLMEHTFQANTCYIIYYNAGWSSTSTAGQKMLLISTNSEATGNIDRYSKVTAEGRQGANNSPLCGIRLLKTGSSDEHYYIRFRQTSGSTMSVTPGLAWIKLN